MQKNLEIIGYMLALLALLHLIFPRYFDWVNDLKGLSLINRQMFYIHTFFIALGLLLMGILCISSASELATTHLGKSVCLGLSIFWFARLLIQFFGYSSSLWKGKRIETTVHIVFIFLWTYFAAIFFYIFWL